MLRLQRNPACLNLPRRRIRLYSARFFRRYPGRPNAARKQANAAAAIYKIWYAPEKRAEHVGPTSCPAPALRQADVLS